MPTILIVEDEEIIRHALRRVLERHKYTVREADSVAAACALGFADIDLIISDLRLPGAPGTDLIELATGTPVLIMTSYASMRSAVDAMKQGAVDYIAKPFDHDEMLATVRRVLSKQHTATHKETAAVNTPVTSAERVDIVARSPAMLHVMDKINKVAPTDASVLIVGETGTGKEIIARAIHRASTRGNTPLITVHCAAISPASLEAELFGHDGNTQDGLIATAENGTLFLDDIDELPLDAQARLLQALQAHTSNIRVIASTTQDLLQMCNEGLFRQDLYYRINVVQITLPPLHEREDDIADIAQHLLHNISKKLNRPALAFAPDALLDMRQHAWPGNVRELENAIERAVILCGDQLILHAEHLDLQRRAAPKTVAPPQTNESLDDYFQRFVRDNENNMSETELASRLGISRKTLWERRQKLGVPRKKC